MGWAHGEVTMEEMLRLVRGLVDVLVLAGGRTSSGTAATWRSGDVKKALRWALFFEEVLTISLAQLLCALGLPPALRVRHHDDFRL